MMRNTWVRLCSCIAILLLVPVAQAQTPDPAVQTVQALCDGLLDTMKHAKELGIKGRYDKLKPLIAQTFDLADMTRIAVGPNWTTMSSQDHEALQAAFERLAVAQYASNFDGYDGEKFVVDPTPSPRPSSTDKVVMTKLITKTDNVQIAYRMHQIGTSWKILDVYYKNSISQLATQRSDFGATVQSGGAAALEKKLSELSEKLMKE
jgi:phospholipid transport system substrate-binding protein